VYGGDEGGWFGRWWRGGVRLMGVFDRHPVPGLVPGVALDHVWRVRATPAAWLLAGLSLDHARDAQAVAVAWATPPTPLNTAVMLKP
jgi:hypothetical protein